MEEEVRWTLAMEEEAPAAGEGQQHAAGEQAGEQQHIGQVTSSAPSGR